MKEECMKMKITCLQVMCEQECGKIIRSSFLFKYLLHPI